VIQKKTISNFLFPMMLEVPRVVRSGVGKISVCRYVCGAIEPDRSLDCNLFYLLAYLLTIEEQDYGRNSDLAPSLSRASITIKFRFDLKSI